MTTGIACVTAGVCVAGFLVLWFSSVHRELSEKRRSLMGLWRQLRLHETASAQVRDGPERKVALDMLATNRGIFQEAVGNYNRLLKRPRNRLPALLMGFRPADEKNFLPERRVKEK